MDLAIPVQTFNNKEAMHHSTGPLWGESTDDQWIPLISDQ